MRTHIVSMVPGWSGSVERLGTLGREAGDAALQAAFALAIVLVGWALAALLGRLVHRLLRAVRFDDGVRPLLGRRVAGGHEPARLVSRVAFALVLATAVLVAAESLGYPLATSVARRLGDVLPRIVTSAVLFVMGSLVAMLVGGVVHRFLEAAEVRTARVQGQAAGIVLTGFSALVALEQLGFAAQFVMAIGVTAVAAGGLGLALAFGLGCRDLARDFVVEYLRSLDDEPPRRPE